MPRYFFDVDDGARQFRDKIGMELSGTLAAMTEAGTLLHTIADIRHIERRPGITTVRVRDALGDEVHERSVDVED